MKSLTLAACIAVFGIAQTPTRGDVHFSANRIEWDGAVTHLTGAVTIETDTLILRADDADVSTDTREIRAHGEVIVRLK